MERTQINPWSWQDRLGFSQAWRVEEPRTIVFVAGQAPISPDGELVGDGDFAAQVRQVFENLRVVLDRAGATFDSVVRLTTYLTDISRLREYGAIRAEYMSGPPPASTAIGVAGLALPGMMVEVEATAVL